MSLVCTGIWKVYVCMCVFLLLFAWNGVLLNKYVLSSYSLCGFGNDDPFWWSDLPLRARARQSGLHHVVECWTCCAAGTLVHVYITGDCLVAVCARLGKLWMRFNLLSEPLSVLPTTTLYAWALLCLRCCGWIAEYFFFNGSLFILIECPVICEEFAFWEIGFYGDNWKEGRNLNGVNNVFSLFSVFTKILRGHIFVVLVMAFLAVVQFAWSLFSGLLASLPLRIWPWLESSRQQMPARSTQQVAAPHLQWRGSEGACAIYSLPSATSYPMVIYEILIFLLFIDSHLKVLCYVFTIGYFVLEVNFEFCTYIGSGWPFLHVSYCHLHCNTCNQIRNESCPAVYTLNSVYSSYPLRIYYWIAIIIVPPHDTHFRKLKRIFCIFQII